MINKFDTVVNKYLKEELTPNPQIKQAATALANAARGKTGVEAAQVISDVSQQASSNLNPQKAKETENKNIQETDPGRKALEDILSDSDNNDIHAALNASKDKDNALKSLLKLGLQPASQTTPQTTNQQSQQNSNINPVNPNQQQKNNNQTGY